MTDGVPADEQPNVDESADGPVVNEAADSAEPADGPVEAAEAEEAGGAEVQIDLASIEALLFSTRTPLTPGRVAELLEIESVKPIRRAVGELNKQYESAGRSFRIEQVAGGYQMLTLPQYAEVIRKHHQKDADAKLTKAAIETLAIIAYKQPILRADVENIRGVACGEQIRNLMEKRLVQIAGRAEEPGRPILYGTTKRFLEVFGLNTIKDLPTSEKDLAAKAQLSDNPQS